jgi:hypothetical protein
VRKVWDGRTNLVELVANGPAAHFSGLRLRTYNPATASGRFERSFSDNGGKTWELNWVAVDTRIPDAPPDR